MAKLKCFYQKDSFEVLITRVVPVDKRLQSETIYNFQKHIGSFRIWWQQRASKELGRGQQKAVKFICSKKNCWIRCSVAQLAIKISKKQNFWKWPSKITAIHKCRLKLKCAKNIYIYIYSSFVIQAWLKMFLQCKALSIADTHTHTH